MANIKNITSEQFKEIDKIILNNGFLTKEQVLSFSEKFKISFFTFKKKLRKHLIPFDSQYLSSILTPYNIKIESNSIPLDKFLKLGNWRFDVFKNSNIRVRFNCIKCDIDSSSRLNSFLNRKYNKGEAYCPKCLKKVTSQQEEYKKNMSISQKICKNTLEFKYNCSIIMKNRWNNQEERNRLIKLMNEATKKEGYKENVSNARKECWRKSDYRNKMTEERKKRWENDEFREKIKKSFLSRTPEQNDISFDKKNNFRNKEYIMPSGKIIKIQGYEDKALELLLKKYKEEELIVGTKNIRKEIGEIFYIDSENKIHRYFPDIYIKSENKIIEVKSVWTYKKKIDINKLKQKACIEQGLNFNFIIFERVKSKNFEEILKENSFLCKLKYNNKFEYIIL
jgi:hypothetical protein